MTSAEYAADYNEVKAVGELNSATRTAEQSEIARFWYEGSPNGWNHIARVVAAQRGLDPWRNARLFGLLNLAMADGFIAGFDGKYFYDFWRPVTAIRAGATDNNPATVADPGWATMLVTPGAPDYPSTHSVLGAAAAETLARFFGADTISFATTSGAPFPGITRSYTSFSQAARENKDDVSPNRDASMAFALRPGVEIESARRIVGRWLKTEISLSAATGAFGGGLSREELAQRLSHIRSQEFEDAWESADRECLVIVLTPRPVLFTKQDCRVKLRLSRAIRFFLFRPTLLGR